MILFTPRQAPLSCATLFAAQPIPVKQALSGLALDGKLGFTLALAFDASAWENLSLEVAMDPLCSVRHESSVLAALLPILLNPSVNAPSGTKLALGTFHPDFVPLSQLPSHLPSAFLTSEDAKFYDHHGFDMDMIKHALAQDLENRSFDRGASTITQQLAKNLFLTHRRTLARKLEEAVLTWRLQKLLSKDRVLELYLNIIELGPGIRGVKQAARVYFGKDVAALLPLESAHLAALTPNPHILARRFRDGQVDEGWQQRLYDLLSMMKRHGRLTRAELAAARTSRLELRDLRQDVATHGTP
jgi:membrane peptidoglycan carboxypeptidase